MGYIDSYQCQISSYNTQIASLRAEVRRYTNLYETLRSFKGTVESSQSSFNSINNSKKRILADISVIKANSKAAKKYYTGLSNILNGTGTKIVTVAYAGLVRLITRKLAEYLSEISRCNNQISRCQQSIRNLESKIDEARRREEEARKNG